MIEVKIKDVIKGKLLTVKKGTPVKDVAKFFSEKKIGGAPVINEKGKLIGIVTESDMIMQDVKIHFPTYISFLDGYIYLESLKRFEDKLHKAVGAKVEDVMTTDVVTIDTEATLEDAATLLSERHLSRVPVMDHDELIGIVTKGDIVKAISRS